MLRNLPTAYRTDPWILALCGAVQILLEELGRETAELPVQIRLSELTWQLPVEERLAGLSPRSGASLEDRRSAVIAKWRSGGPGDPDSDPGGGGRGLQRRGGGGL